MKTIAYRKQQVAMAVAFSFILVGIAIPSLSQAGNVNSGNGDVNQVQGRSSISHASGNAISASGQTHDVLGRGNGSEHGGTAQRVATRNSDGLLDMAGRGSAPNFARENITPATTVAANH